jgi:hypothetical protein
MKSFLQKNPHLVFYAAWILLVLIQSGYTTLLDDEAYYWVYSKFPAWGYFDHPPMVAMLIKMGYFFFQNELGVRLFFALLNVLSLLILEKLIDNENPFLFYAIAISLGILQIGGFLAVPDTPLIFFTALFFLLYQKFLQQMSIWNGVLLGIVTAAMLYSKYHAILIIFFVILSNLKLLIRYQAYISGIVALLLFLPHLWWQYQHDWISLQYHLFESNVNPYKLSFTLEYIGGQILLAGPLAGILLLPGAFIYRSKNVFKKGLKFTFIGIYLFFLLSSFRGRVEANWTSPAIVPLIILGHNFLSEKIKWRKWFFRLLPATMVIILFARIAAIVPILPLSEIQKQIHGWKNWPQQMKERTKNLPIVFENSYQRASKYWFYSGQMTYSLNWYKERMNNYNYWPIEDSLLGKPVFILDAYDLDSFKTKVKTGIGWLGYKYDSSFASFTKVKLIPAENTIHVSKDSPFVIHIQPALSPKYLTYIMAHQELKITTVLGIFDQNGWIKDLPVSISLTELVTHPNTLKFYPQMPEGEYYLIFSIYHIGTIRAPHNSSKIKLVVE